jgi:hypothetical protein
MARRDTIDLKCPLYLISYVWKYNYALIFLKNITKLRWKYVVAASLCGKRARPSPDEAIHSRRVVISHRLYHIVHFSLQVINARVRMAGYLGLLNSIMVKRFFLVLLVPTDDTKYWYIWSYSSQAEPEPGLFTSDSKLRALAEEYVACVRSKTCWVCRWGMPPMLTSLITWGKAKDRELEQN